MPIPADGPAQGCGALLGRQERGPQAATGAQQAVAQIGTDIAKFRGSVAIDGGVDAGDGALRGCLLEAG